MMNWYRLQAALLSVVLTLLGLGAGGADPPAAPAEKVRSVVRDPADAPALAKGICNYSADELREVMGLKSDAVRERLPRGTEEAVHRDYLVLN